MTDNNINDNDNDNFCAPNFDKKNEHLHALKHRRQCTTVHKIHQSQTVTLRIHTFYIITLFHPSTVVREREREREMHC